MLAAAPHLRAILSVCSAPQANIDVAAATARGIAVLHTVGRTDHGVAEFTVALALALTRYLMPASAWIRSRSPDFDPREDFYRGTVWGRARILPNLHSPASSCMVAHLQSVVSSPKSFQVLAWG
ncbi:hypothetical protein [Mesorhizobium sp.]|uniref:hypothetical protein n=1 Tax=Mesorhizobium sp. TaxID=1871066 RepID=UPI000FE4F8D8|nr:MAG: hypothetical protein EOR75_32905 [Mesorhizobium sp.]